MMTTQDCVIRRHNCCLDEKVLIQPTIDYWLSPLNRAAELSWLDGGLCVPHPRPAEATSEQTVLFFQSVVSKSVTFP